jgi:hypothetical protein
MNSETSEKKGTKMKTIRIPLALLTAIAALAVTTAANAQYKPVGDDGITASPKVRQQLDERRASQRANNPTPIAAMGCPKCIDLMTTEPNPAAKPGQVLAGTAGKQVARHACTACTTTFTAVGAGKAKHTVTTHKCSAEAPTNANCCAMN